MENNTLDISWPDVQNYNEQLAAAISEEYYRFYPYLCRALKEFSLQHHSEIQKNKDIFVGFKDFNSKQKNPRTKEYKGWISVEHLWSSS